MRYFLVFIVSFYFASAFADNMGSSRWLCSNSSFLQEPLQLFWSGDVWSLQAQEESPCLLSQVAEENSLGNYKDWMLLQPSVLNEGDSCAVMSKMSSPKKRQLVALRVSPKVLQEEEGFVQISLDNTMAEWGTENVRSFLKCFSQP